MRGEDDDWSRQLRCLQENTSLVGGENTVEEGEVVASIAGACLRQAPDGRIAVGEVEGWLPYPAATGTLRGEGGVGAVVRGSAGSVRAGSRGIGQGLAVALLPSAFAPALRDLKAIPVIDGPGRVEYLAWNSFNPSPATTAFIDNVSYR